MSDALNQILNTAIPQWAKLTNTKLGTSKYTYVMGSTSAFQSYDLQKYVEELNACRTHDMTGTTAILILRGLFEAYVEEKSFKVRSLLYDAPAVEKEIAKFRALYELVTQTPCEQAVSAFKDTLRAAAVHYGYDLAKLQEHLVDERALGQLRLAASRSLDKLATHQFTQGDRDPRPLQYNRQIFEFSSINACVHALRHQMISGITLALIRHIDDHQAYFVLGLRNGDTTTILTDFVEGAHPEYYNMTRRPERRLDERASLHWFPYRLLDAKAVRQRHEKTKTSLVPRDAKAMPIAEITDLEPSEFVWLTLLFDLVAAKFDRDDYKTPELSYTGEMVVAPHALVDAQTAIVRSGQYTPLVLPKLTAATTTPDLAGNHAPLGHNAWLEERYRDRVPEILLDVVGERQALDVGKRVAKLLPGEIKHGTLPEVRRQPGVISWGGSDRRLRPIAPQALDPSYFGTAKAVERTRAWYARANLIQAVQRLASAEFAAKQAMILSWYRKRIERNLPFIWRAVACGELVAPTTTWKSDEDHGFPARDVLRWKEANILEQKHASTWHKAFKHSAYDRGILLGGWSMKRRVFECAIDTRLTASVFSIIRPDNPRALALLMGIPEKKIPWPLQHWTTREPYTGNSILSRIDPQDAWLDDPWRHLELRLTISLSKREFNRLRKIHGLPPKEFA